MEECKWGLEVEEQETCQMKMERELKCKDKFPQNMNFVPNISIQLMQQIEATLQSEIDMQSLCIHRNVKDLKVP